MAKFQKGRSGNPNGRRKGAKNKSTEALRGLIQSFIENNLPRLQADFDAMKPAERLSFLNSLLRHVLPDPLSFEKLSEGQLEQLHQYILQKYGYEIENP
jgi:hypothetical protein